jgi:hypothetical protein
MANDHPMTQEATPKFMRIPKTVLCALLLAVMPLISVAQPVTAPVCRFLSSSCRSYATQV